jgi:hypothetical protein
MMVPSVRTLSVRFQLSHCFDKVSSRGMDAAMGSRLDILSRNQEKNAS